LQINMAKYQPDDWYQLLVDQSKTHHIYDLIHEGMNPHFNPTDLNGIVVIDPRDMPENPAVIPLDHVAKTATESNQNGLILLKNNRLTDYLEKATAMQVYEGDESEYVLLS